MARRAQVLLALAQAASGAVLRGGKPLETHLNAAQCAHAAGMGLGRSGCEDLELSSRDADGSAAMCWDGFTPPRRNNTIYVMHLPKAAGCSFVSDLSRFVDRRQIWSNEGCFGLRHKYPQISKVVSMVRDPRTMVLSQYWHCRKSNDHPVLRSKTAMPESFSQWVDHWAKSLASGRVNGTLRTDEDEFGCTRPVNLMAQRMNCEEDVFNYPNHMNTEFAVNKMMHVDFVGIMERYQESLCLLHAQLFNSLPSYCDCSKSEKWVSFQQHEVRHGVDYDHDENQYSDETWRQVEEITKSDYHVYKAAVARFHVEIYRAEQKFGVKIMCDKSVGSRYQIGPDFGANYHGQ